MVKVNPRAYLSRLRNVRRGVVTRSRIIESMGAGATVPQICFRSGLSPSNVRYHLTNMMTEGLVLKKQSRGRTWWMMTGAGQKTIDEVT